MGHAKCAVELSNYPELPEIRVSEGTFYDTQSLNSIKGIGDGFLNAVQRESLFGNSEYIVDYQLFYTLFARPFSD